MGEDFPVLIKIEVQDAIPGGMKAAEGKRAAQLLAEWGFDALETRQGRGMKGMRIPNFEPKSTALTARATSEIGAKR